MAKKPQPEPDQPKKPSDENVIKRVRWYPPHPSHVYLRAAKVLEETDSEILAHALRQLAKCEAQEEARPGQYFVPERQDVVEWLHTLMADIDYILYFLEHDQGPIVKLAESLPDDYKETCAVCGKLFFPERSSARYCSNACRQRAYRQRQDDD